MGLPSLWLVVLLVALQLTAALREFRSWSTREHCSKSEFPNYPFAYSKYQGQSQERKGRVNSNMQDFRHECTLKGGLSKCTICEDIDCWSDLNPTNSSDPNSNGTCSLQLQGVRPEDMSVNIPIVSDTAWAVGGMHRRDYGHQNTTHFCVMTTGGKCIDPSNDDFEGCSVRCFGYGVGSTRNYTALTSSVVDVYPDMGRWENDNQVDLWQYPRNCTEQALYGQACALNGPGIAGGKMPGPTDFNPQGFTFRLAGSGEAGFTDGDGDPLAAMFDGPEDVTLDENSVIYVADTLNHAIRMVSSNGTVTTLAGKGNGHNGYMDGDCEHATFNNPKGVDVVIKTDSNGDKFALIAIADTGNHRIRQLSYYYEDPPPHSSRRCTVKCFSGLCGNNTLSESDFKSKSWPISGFADGPGATAKFSAPESVAYMDDDYIAVADTGNFLLRYINDQGETWTLAGGIANGTTDPLGNPLGGCPPPCLVGVPGYADGALHDARFYNPRDVTRGVNNTLYITDEHRVRILELPFGEYEVQTIKSRGRVSTLAGKYEALMDPATGENYYDMQGQDDGRGEEATFFGPSGVFVSDDGIAYVTDAASCRIRRLTPMALVAEPVQCTTRPHEIIRPSGCTSFDQAIDKTGRKVSRVEKNIQYNYGTPYKNDLDRGKFIKNCVGVPPPDTLDKHFVLNATANVRSVLPEEFWDDSFLETFGDNLVIDDDRVTINEDSEQGMALIVLCPSGCASTADTPLEGNRWYSDNSSICMAAIHDGKLTNAGGFVQITTQRRAFIWQSNFGANTFDLGTTANSLTSTDIPIHEQRIFNVETYNIAMTMVNNVAGSPAAPLELGCGNRDSQPASQALFSTPHGITGERVINDTSFLYIADSGNNVIRGLSAVCTQICENGGRCIAADTCVCPVGWEGVDCAKPVCSTPCGRGSVCTAPDMCTCKPGFSGPNCDIAQCIQTCQNGGTCSSPDTCSCSPGWFDSNCTTPICSNTCANGGQCVAAETCRCPAEWQGTDCRQPVCVQECKNGGRCMAPNTCSCPPQYINYDCGTPVCTQGMFKANPSIVSLAVPYKYMYSSDLNKKWATYKPCNLDQWCTSTDEFECFEKDKEMKYDVLQVPSGGDARKITGRKVLPTRCMEIELPTDYKIPYELLAGSGNTTGYRRYAPKTPYESNPANPWRGYLEPMDGRTGPWSYSADRQIARVDWLNMTQGFYVCANGGNCTMPDICECAPGWMGFDCRTPICSQGYFHDAQKQYVSQLTQEHYEANDTSSAIVPGPGESSSKMELTFFARFMGHNTYNLSWPYSNPNYTMQFEKYVNATATERVTVNQGGRRYVAAANWTAGFRIETLQGGYRCSIRSVTQWENQTYLYDHPNFYSNHMDKKIEHDDKIYTYWENMYWPPVHAKSRVLQKIFSAYVNRKSEGVWEDSRATGDVSSLNPPQEVKNITFQYTNQGWRRFGIWNRTSYVWMPGTCIMEFYRTCADDPSKQFDLEAQKMNVFVQDPDLAYRPRVTYNDERVVGGHTRWNTNGGECIDTVIRGCYNNGTCAGYDQPAGKGICDCADGWAGDDCTVPQCDFECLHHGLCTGPGVCSCEKGWEGAFCETPICAQECQNKGVCVAPDVCQCKQFPSTFRDNRENGGRPQFQKVDGSPMDSGWTGYDCSIPICVQAQRDDGSGFLLNTRNENGYTEMGGHGGDDLLTCTALVNGVEVVQPRCPQFDRKVTGNNGRSFQSGCGYDPLDTGCCMEPSPNPDNMITCLYCPREAIKMDNNTLFCTITSDCDSDPKVGCIQEQKSAVDSFTQADYDFIDESGNFKYCGKYHSPRRYPKSDAPQLDIGSAVYFVPVNPSRRYLYSSYNQRSNFTSNRFLCNVDFWYQGDYNDDAGLGSAEGVGSIHGLTYGRHIRVNDPNLFSNNSATQEITVAGPKLAGEGLYSCFNGGSCLGPDLCSCKDGYAGFDCNEPLCRHLRMDGSVSACMNSGICENRDKCDCVKSESVLWTVHKQAPRGLTGWSGSDCSIPMCTQGHFDPFCTDLPQAPAGQGCYRCANSGNCTAPDICTCAPGWTGFDCKTPVCETFADPLTRKQLGTVFEEKIIAFESDPCGVESIYGISGWKGRKYTRGNCTLPNQCTCLCKDKFNVKACHKAGVQCDGPWQDPLYQIRNVLGGRGVSYTFGTTPCSSGYEGNVDYMDRFTTCHLNIYVPSDIERASITYIIIIAVTGFFAAVIYGFIRRRLARQYLLAQIERRRSKRSSEESLLQTNAFTQ